VAGQIQKEENDLIFCFPSHLPATPPPYPLNLLITPRLQALLPCAQKILCKEQADENASSQSEKGT